MTAIVPDVRRIGLLPRDALNAYVVGDVLVDTGFKSSAKKILAALDGWTPSAVVITHAHGDHAGSAREISETLSVPVWVGAQDVPAMDDGVQEVPASKVAPIIRASGKFPPMRVTRTLAEGDEVAGFAVLDTPGHSAGHLSLWRESDRTLICGDVLINMNLFTTKVGVHDPPTFATPDPARNRESQRRLAALEPQTVLTGHGPPLRDAAAALRSFLR
jgi:glyoxylase-like metal-dependent hydrolase (beta-lactamase superfamily II)